MGLEVNYLAVLSAAVVSMAIGFIYYSKAVLGGPWMKEKGLTEESLKEAQKEMSMLYTPSFVLALITAFVLTHVIAYSENFYGFWRLQTGLTSALWMWVGFIMPVQATEQIFGEKKWKLFAINTGYQLVSLLAMGVVLTLL